MARHKPIHGNPNGMLGAPPDPPAPPRAAEPAPARTIEQLRQALARGDSIFTTQELTILAKNHAPGCQMASAFIEDARRFAMRPHGNSIGVSGKEVIGHSFVVDDDGWPIRAYLGDGTD